MALFITTKAQANRRGVFALEKVPPALLRVAGTGKACLIEQLPWGPAQTLTTPGSVGERLYTFAPPGMSHTGSGYLAMIKKAFPILAILRVLGDTAAKASAVINYDDSGTPTPLVTVELKYPGSEGNNVVVTASAATDGDPNHFNITATVTGPSGTFSETVHNWNVSGTGEDTVLSEEERNRLVLIGEITKEDAGVPILGSTTCTGGTDGTITATEYVGTQGSNNKGVAKLEGDNTIDHFFCGDPGNSLRAAVNAGFKAHADYRTDRVAYLNGNAGQAASAARTDVANYRSQRVVYCDPWCYMLDDVDGTRRRVTTAAFAAAVASQLPPSTPISWKSDVVQTMLNGIDSLEADRGTEDVAANTQAGICTFIREDEGGFTMEADVTTIAPVTPAKQDLTRTRMGHFMARTLQQSLRGSSDLPNLPIYQQDILDLTTSFLEGLKRNSQREDAVFLPHIVEYGLGDIETENPLADQEAGDFTVPIDAKTSTGMKRIFLNFNYGPTVRPTVTAT